MSGTALVLLAVVILVLVVLALVIWLILRNRGGSDLPQGSATYTSQGPVSSDGGAEPPRADVPSADDREPAPDAVALDVAGQDAATDVEEDIDDAGDETGDSTVDDGTATSPRGTAGVAEEFVSDGLSDLGSAPASDADGEVSGAPPRTPTEAFGAATGSADDADHSAAQAESSVLDGPDADSTPLFRTMREELFGADEESPGSETPVGESVLVADEVIADAPQAPEADLRWSDERRTLDEQAHDEEPAQGDGEQPLDQDERPEPVSAASPGADPDDEWVETVNEGVVDTGAVGVGVDGSLQEEEHVSNTLVEPNSIKDDAVGDDAVSDDAVGDGGATAVYFGETRRTSELAEVVDGGFGIGSAAPIADGAQPLGHPIKANLDSKTYQDFRSPWYDETEPDVWFLDAGFAERAGFHRAE